MIGKEIGPYRIIEKIGQGGMGIVYKGLHLKLDQEVAIKVLSPEFSQDAAMRERFITEAKIQAKISHPNVVNILNYVEDGGNLFLVMEFIQGETLESRLAKKGKLDDAVGSCINVLSALEYMHSRGIVHRDIKPGNIMFLDDGSVKVMDFGIAKITGEKGQTKTGVRLGTLWYMSPEQIQGEEATVVSDIYAVGVTLYQMATGKVPYNGDSEYKIMKAHLEERPIPPWEINSNVPENVGHIILKAIAKDKKDRFQSAREFADALKGAARQDTAHPSTRMVQAVEQDQRLPGLPKLGFKLDNKYWLVILLCLGVIFIAFGLYIGLRNKHSNPTIPTVMKESPPITSQASGSSGPSTALPETINPSVSIDHDYPDDIEKLESHKKKRVTKTKVKQNQPTSKPLKKYPGTTTHSETSPGKHEEENSNRDTESEQKKSEWEFK